MGDGTTGTVVARFARFALSELSAEALSSMPDAEALDPDEYRRSVADVIVVREGESWSIVDGFHRVSGIANWAEAEGYDLAAVTIRVIDCTGTDERIIGLAAEPGEHQARAIEAIEGAA